MTDSRPEDAAKAIVDMSNQLAAKRAIHQKMGRENQKDLAANMRIEGFKADLTWDPNKGPWRPHVLHYMKKTDLNHIDTPLSVSRRYRVAAKRAVAIHGDDIEAAIESMVDDGLDPWISSTVLQNMGVTPAIEPNGRIFTSVEGSAIPENGQRTNLSENFVERTFGVENDTYDLADLSEINIEFQDTLNERQQQVWGYHLAGQSNSWIADVMGVSREWVWMDLKKIKEAWATFIEAA